MKVSIVPIDKVVYVDGQSFLNIDLSWIPQIEGKTIHAVQWDDETEICEIEFIGSDENLQTNIFGVEGIVDFQKAVTQWTKVRDDIATAEELRIQEEERITRENEEAVQAQFIEFEREYNTNHLPPVDDEEESVEDDEEEEDLFYDIEELLKEI